jgi:IS5 family transposase
MLPGRDAGSLQQEVGQPDEHCAAVPLTWSPKKSVLHRTISAIRPETWEAVNRALLTRAKQDKLESGAMVRIDSTVTAALMHEPSDSALLWDAVRVMTRLLRQAAALPGAPALQWRDRRRLAKKRARAIEYSRGHNNRRRLYRGLIAATRATQAAVQQAAERLDDLPGIAVERWRAQLSHYLPLIERILVQSERRVLRGQPVPVGEKVLTVEGQGPGRTNRHERDEGPRAAGVFTARVDVEAQALRHAHGL